MKTDQLLKLIVDFKIKPHIKDQLLEYDFINGEIIRKIYNELDIDFYQEDYQLFKEMRFLMNLLGGYKIG